MMNENLPNNDMNDRVAIVTAMHRIPRTVRDISIAEAPNVIDGRAGFARLTKVHREWREAEDCA